MSNLRNLIHYADLAEFENVVGAASSTCAHYNHGSNYVQWKKFGGGNNANGYYRENLDNDTIEFSSITGQLENIILEYISDGSTGVTGDDIKVHTYAQEALASFIYWKSIQRKRGINANEKMFARKEFYNQKRLARARMNTFTKAEALQATRKAFKQAPKL